MEEKSIRKFKVRDVVHLVNDYGWIDEVKARVCGRTMVIHAVSEAGYINLSYADTGEIAKLRPDLTEDRAWEFPAGGLELDVFMTEVRKTHGE